jgi:enoyl-CoA hydratase/carnithine racemase
MDLQDLIYTKQDHIAILTLNRPERMNAFSAAMGESIVTAARDADADDNIRVLIITGAGRGFCSGLDLKPQAESPSSALAQGASSKASLTALVLPQVLHRLDKPIIASINGPAIGLGLELALLCDLRIAADTARIGDSHVQRGFVPDNAGQWTLPRLVGWARAAEVMFLADLFDARTAEHMGLVNKVVPADELWPETMKWAERIAANAPLAVQFVKRSMRLGLESSLEMALEESLLRIRYMFQTEDAHEAIAAFWEKRKPEFKGR